MVEWMVLFLVQMNSVFSEWTSNVIFYGLCMLLMIIVYSITYQIIRLLIVHRLVQTLTLFVTILFVIIGGYAYANMRNDIHIKRIFLFAFESITLFGAFLFCILVIRSIRRKI